MTEHIMLLFLSNVKVDYRTKNVVVSQYAGMGETKTTNESAVRYLLGSTWQGKPISRLARIFVFASSVVRTQPVDAEDVPLNAVGQHLTHLEYFKYRLQHTGAVKEIQTCINEDTIYPYDEQAGMPRMMGMVADMAQCIQRWRQSLPAETTVVLHADCTGGMRHVNMMMMAVMRLIQYQQIQIGHVLYSNYNQENRTGTVQEADEIYRLFDFIAGAEEFVRFGSVDGICNYFSRFSISHELSVLLQAMHGFADEMKLCRRSQFVQAVQRLQTAFMAFDDSRLEEQSIDNKLMQQLQFRIQQEYAPLLKAKADVLVMINWCLQHGYLQQALTLYTEGVPAFLVQTGIIQQTEKSKKKLEEAEAKDSLDRDPEYYLLNVYTPGTAADYQKARQFLQKQLQTILRGLQDGTGALSELEEKFEAALADRQFVLLQREQCYQVLAKLQTLCENPKVLLSETALGDSEIPGGTLCPEACRLDMLTKSYGKQRLQVLFTYWLNQASCSAYVQAFSDIRPKMEVLYPQAVTVYQMLKTAMISSPLPEEELLSLVQRYKIIKFERNDSHHAKKRPQGCIFHVSEQNSYAEQLRVYMQEGICSLQLAAETVRK